MYQPNCDCCGCSSFSIYPGTYELIDSEGETIEPPWYELLNSGGDIIDSPRAMAPQEVTTIAATWTHVEDFSVGSHVLAHQGGTVSLDLGAARIDLHSYWCPLLSRGDEYQFIYDAGSPPESDELDAKTTASLYGDAVATVTMALSEWTPGIEWADPWPIDGSAETYNAVYPFKPDWYLFYNRSLYILHPNIGNGIEALLDYSQADNDLATVGDFKDRPIEDVDDIITFCENMKLWAGNGIDEWFLGWTVYEPRSTGFDTPVIVGFNHRISLEYEGDTTLVILADIPTAPAATLHLNISSVADANGEDPPEELPTSGFFTAWVDRGSKPVAWNVDLNYPEIQSSRWTIYLDGVQVFQEIDQSEGQDVASTWLDTAAVGVYLIVRDIDSTYEEAWSGAGPDLRRRKPLPYKTFSSTVIEHTLPVIGFTPPRDFHHGGAGPFAYGTTGPVVGMMLATEPIFPASDTTPKADEDLTSVLCKHPHQAAELIGSSLAIGTHEVRVANTVDSYADIAGNHPEENPKVSYTVHAAIPEDREGCIATLEDPSFQTREHYRARLISEPVTQLKLHFSRKVDPDGVTSEQISITKDDEAFAGATIAPLGTGCQDWIITIPSAGQDERSFFLLTYDPAGVFTDDIQTLTFQDFDSFPTVGAFKTIYRYLDIESGEWQCYTHAVVSSVPQYVQIPDGSPPLDINGNPYDPEPCVAAVRAGWLMADMDGYLRQIDCATTVGTVGIGRAVSIGKQLSLDSKKAASEIGTKGGSFLTPGMGTFSPLVNYEKYSCGVPSLTSPADDCSYFGLTTTIDPCPPALVSACASPDAQQRHASAIRCDEDITSIEVSLVAFEPGTNTPADFSKVKFWNQLNLPPNNAWYNAAFVDGTPYENLNYPITVDVAVMPEDSHRAAAVILAKDGGPLTFTATLDGDTLSQNVWGCDGVSLEATLPVLPAESRDVAEVIDKEDYYSSTHNVIGESVTTYLPSEVLGMPSIPRLCGAPGVVVRAGLGDTYNINGEDCGVVGDSDAVLPGDYISITPGNPAAWRYAPWWVFRLPVKDFEDDWNHYHRRLRRLLDGEFTIRSLQGSVSASRNHSTYATFKTTILSDLQIDISLRVALKLESNYAERQLLPEKYLYGNTVVDQSYGAGCADAKPYVTPPLDYNYPDGIPYNFTFESPWDGTDGGGAEGLQLYLRGSLTSLGRWSTATPIATKATTSDVLGDINDTIVMSKEQEEQFSNGEELYFFAHIDNNIYGDFFWKIKKV